MSKSLETIIATANLHSDERYCNPDTDLAKAHRLIAKLAIHAIKLEKRIEALEKTTRGLDIVTASIGADVDMILGQES